MTRVVFDWAPARLRRRFQSIVQQQAADSKMRSSLSLALVLLAGAAHAAEAEFLFDALHGKTPYRASWEKLMKLVQPTPDWLVQFNRNFDGVASQITNLTIDGKPYEISFVCKPSDCAAHKFVVLFDASGEHAYGALGGKDNDPAFFGGPSQAEQDALAKAVKG
jgi:Inhibitor of vertebrate lysozyme (Ivy)